MDAYPKQRSDKRFYGNKEKKEKALRRFGDEENFIYDVWM